jgi:hypothetical protein
MALAEHGCNVTALCPAGHPLTFVSTVRAAYPYSGLRSLRNLRACIRTVRPDIIVPCDDGVVAQIHALYRDEPSLRPLIERSLGAPSSHPILASRHDLLQTAARLGIATPTTRLISNAQDIATWHQHYDSAVLKIDGECGGNGVRICGSTAETLAAWRDLKAPTSLALAVKRLIIERDPLALWSRRQRPARQISIQSLIRGRPANTMMACFDGRVVSLVSVIVLVADGLTGAATIVRTENNPEMARAAALLARELRLTGFYGLDFMIESSTGTALLIELNPRCTQLGHLDVTQRGSLAAEFTAVLQGQQGSINDSAAENGTTTKPTTVAFFPQAFATGSGNSNRRAIDSLYRDIPAQEPALLQELLLEPWPQRRRLARLYHWARPPIKSHQVLFDDDGNVTTIEGQHLEEPSAGNPERPHTMAPQPLRIDALH